MSRRIREHDNDDGVQGSFLDIIANIVGILILLVLVVGVRVAMQPPAIDEATAQPADLLTEEAIELKRQAVVDASRDIVRIKAATFEVAAEANSREQQRLDLATYVAAVEHELEEEKQKLKAADAARLELRTAMAEADFEWQQLMLQKVALASDAEQPTKVVHTPTPIVRNRSEKTIHLRLEDQRVAVVPFEQLVKAIDNRPVDAHRRDLERLGGIGRLGPVDGFELHFAVLTRTSPPGPQGIRQLLSFIVGEIRPSTTQAAGESIDEALQPESDMMRALKASPSVDAVVTAWVYPNGVSDFRQLQAELRERGYMVDLRLLREGTHITFSPFGRGTAAQ